MAPIIAGLLQAGLPILAKAFATKGSEVIQDKLGVNIPDLLGSEEGRVKLRELELKHAEFLLSLDQADKERELAWFGSEIADKASARVRDSEIVKAAGANLRANLMFAIAVAAILWLVWVIWKSADISEYTKGIFTLVLGRFLGYLDNIYNYEFGTTRTSRTKDMTIAKLTKEAE